MNIYDKAAWERLLATADAVTTFTAYSTYTDGRTGNSTVAFPALNSTAFVQVLFHAYEPGKNRHHIMRTMAS
jgi:hypothetical protein